MELPPQDPALLMILAGPTGIGKSTLCRRLAQTHPSIRRVITATTRPPRQGEQHGLDYYFLGGEDFQQQLEAGAFFESAVVHGHRYGTLKEEILPQRGRERDLIMNVDVQGVEAYQRAVRDDPKLKKKLVTIFLMPPGLEVLRHRLTGRGETDEADIRKRLETAKGEMPRWSTYDFCLVSGTKDEDFERVEAIWKSEKLRVSRLIQGGEGSDGEME